MASPVGVTPVAQSALSSTTQPASSQNLFEYAAEQAKVAGQGMTPNELGADLMKNLDGYVQRVNAHRQADGGQLASDNLGANGLQPLDLQGPDSVQGASGEPVSKLDDVDIDQMIDSLGKTFDHATETVLVSKGLTQVVGSAKTLLRGQ